MNMYHVYPVGTEYVSELARIEIAQSTAGNHMPHGNARSDQLGSQRPLLEEATDTNAVTPLLEASRQVGDHDFHTGRYEGRHDHLDP
jgi:hypothetical protein